MGSGELMPKKHKPYKPRNTHKPSNPYNKESTAKALQQRQSYRWEKVSKIMRKKFPICQCIGCDEPSQTVHHIKGAEKNPTLFFIETNLIPLCNPHHATVSMMERTGRTAEAEDLFTYWPDVIDASYDQ